MTTKRITREKLTLTHMIALYARHHPDEADYQSLQNYAMKRLDKCVFGEQKPACKQCPVHCYQAAPRQQMKVIMRWAGPRMLLRHPILTLHHLADDRRLVPPLPEKYRPKK